MLLALAIALPGCLSGVGPTLGLRTTGEVSAGWGASTTLGGYGVEAGQSYSLTSGRAATYGAALAFRRAGPELDGATSYLGGALGIAGGEGGRIPYAAAFPMVVVGSRRCTGRSDQGRAQFELGVGVRFIAGAGELYLAPKLDYFDPWCAD